jgi:hypothetical protein
MASAEHDDNIPEDGLDVIGLFQDPDGYYQPKPPTTAQYQLGSGQLLNVRLVGSHPLYVRTDRSLACLFIGGPDERSN